MYTQRYRQVLAVGPTQVPEADTDRQDEVLVIGPAAECDVLEGHTQAAVDDDEPEEVAAGVVVTIPMPRRSTRGRH